MKSDTDRLAVAIRALRDVAGYPGCNWRSKTVRAFTLHWWHQFDVARWLGEPTGVRRAFRGVDSRESIARITQALGDVARIMVGFGIDTSRRGEVTVFLWDADLDLPNQLEVIGKTPSARNSSNHGLKLASPLSRVFADGSPPAVLLPTFDRTRDHQRTVNWLSASAVHEGFHALLRDWLGIKRVQTLFASLAWQKMEEMCAVWMETKVEPENRSHLDYGRAWLGTLMLTHADQVTRFAPATWAGFDEDHEDYPHYVMLATLDRLAGKKRQLKHWLPTFWEQARKAKVTDSPWKILDAVTKGAGGLGAVFEQAMVDTLLAEPANRVVCQILEEFGPPAATVVEPGAPSEIRFPPLSGHFFHFAPAKTGRDAAILVRGSMDDLQKVKVRAWRLAPGDRNAEPEARVNGHEPVADRAKWTCRIDPKTPLPVMVCHAGIEGRTVVAGAASD